jgi:hypothetical protein
MPGIHGLQQVIAALIAYLAHDDAVWAMAESGSEKLARSDGNLTWNCLDCFPPDGVRMVHLQFCWLLDDNKTFMLWNVVE